MEGFSHYSCFEIIELKRSLSQHLYWFNVY